MRHRRRPARPQKWRLDRARPLPRARALGARAVPRVHADVLEQGLPSTAARGRGGAPTGQARAGARHSHGGALRLGGVGAAGARGHARSPSQRPALYRHRRPTPPQPALPPWSASPRSPAARSTFTAGATLSPGALAHVPVFGGRLPARPDDTSEGAARLLPVLLSMGRRVPAEAGPAELWEELYRVRPIDAALTVLHTTR